MHNDNLRQALVTLFERMANLYGSKWVAMWKDRDLQAIVSDWREELDAFNGSAEFVAKVVDEAMRHLPEQPPTAPQFRRMCEQARERLRVPAVPPPSAPVRGPTRAELDAVLALRERVAAGSLFARPSTDWAFDLVAKHERGEPVSHAGVRMAREVVENRRRAPRREEVT